MTYELLYSPLARKQLLSFEKEVQKRIISALERIRIRPESYVSKLVGEITYKLRVGDYRIIMDVDKGKLMILVIRIGHRRNVYRSLSR